MKNLIIRTITGALFVALVVASTILSGRILFYVFLLFTCIAIYEYGSLLKEKNIQLSYLFYAIAVSIYCIPFFQHYAILQNSNILFHITLSLTTLFFILELFRNKNNPFETIGYSLLGICWIVIPFSLVNIFSLQFDKQANYLLLIFFIIIWMNDTFAYCAGSLFGKHKLFERISPKKTWEGSLISACLTLICSYFLPKLFHVDLTNWQIIGLALLIIVFGTFGDLVESLFKRNLGVKDSGNILPGHGGILDRFDSFLLAMPFVLLYLTIIIS